MTLAKPIKQFGIFIFSVTVLALTLEVYFNNAENIVYFLSLFSP